MHLFRRQPPEGPLPVRPPSEFMPQIPDFLDEANTEDWEKIQRQEAAEEKLPTPPAKDAVYKPKAPTIHALVLPQPHLQRSTPSPEDETKGWDMLDSQFISNPNDNNNLTSNDHQVQIYDVDDDDAALEYSAFLVIRESSTTEPPPVRTTDFTLGILGRDTEHTNPWAGVKEIRMDEEAERLPNNAEQDPEKDLPPQPLESGADRESTASEASDAPSNEPSNRLDRMLLLRAQMVEVEGRLNDPTNPRSDQEIKQTEKILRKMRRQAERRYAAGICLAQHSDDQDEDDTVSLEGMHPKISEKKIEEKIEALLSPDAKSLFVKIVVARKAVHAKKQKVNVSMLLDRYNLTLYTSRNAANEKISIVNIPEEKFADWLTEYRILRKEELEEDSSAWR